MNQKNMTVLNVKNYKKIDLTNSIDTLDFFIYLTQDINRLIHVTLAYGLEKIEFSEFVERFYSQKDFIYKYSWLIQYPTELYNRFIEDDDTFSFDSYFFDNVSSTDSEKISKLNHLRKNIENLLLEIKTETEQERLEFPKIDNIEKFITDFKNKFTNYLIISDYISNKPFKNKIYIYKLLLYLFGVKLDEILSKLEATYMGFLKEPLINSTATSNINNQLSNVTNSFPDIFKSNEVYTKFIEYTSKHIIEPYVDFSYLFQRLLDEKLIYKVAHLEFAEWLFRNNFIFEKNYKKFQSNRGFRSLLKSQSEERINNFNNVFGV